MWRRWRDDIAWAGGTLGVLLLTAFSRLALFGEVDFCRDTHRMHFPLKVYIASRLRRGELPLWFPFDGLGAPLAADPVAALFHPTTLLYLVLDPATAIALTQLGSLVVAFLGLYWLARRLKAAPGAAAAGAAMFAVSGAMFSTLDNLTFLLGASTFPAFLAALHLALTGRRRRLGFVLAALLLAQAILAGDLQAAYLYGLVGLPFGLLVVPPDRRLRAFGLVAGVGLSSILVGAVQLAPTVALLGVLDRGSGQPWDIASQWSLHVLRVPGLFFGDLLRSMPIHPAISVRTLVGRPELAEWQYSVFLGRLALPALVWSVLLPLRDRRRAAFWVLAGAVLLLWAALGRGFGLYRLLYQVAPLWDHFRYPQKLVPYASALFAVTVALGLTAAAEQPRRAARAGLGVGVVLLVLGLAAWGGAGSLAALVAHGGSSLNEAVRQSAALYVSRLWPALLEAAGISALAALLMRMSEVPRLAWTPLPAMLLVVLVIADGYVTNQHVLDVCASDRDILWTDSLLGVVLQRESRGLGKGRVTTTVAEAVAMAGESDGDQLTWAASLRWERQSLFPDSNALRGIETTTSYLPMATLRFAKILRDEPEAWIMRLAQVFNGTHLVTNARNYRRAGFREDLILAEVPNLNLILAKAPAALPRAFVAVPRFVASPEAARSALDAPQVRKGQVAAVEMSAAPGTDWAPAPAEVAEYAPERVVVRARLEHPGVLVLNDAWFPGWEARVDGRPTPILHANLLARGVLLEPGPHEIVFTYPIPASLELGAAVTVFGLFALLAVVAIPERRRDTAPPTAPQ